MSPRQFLLRLTVMALVTSVMWLFLVAPAAASSPHIWLPPEVFPHEAGAFPRVTLDRHGLPHFVSISQPGAQTFGTLIYSYKSSNGWHHEPVATTKVWYPNISVDRFDNVHISYVDHNEFKLKYAFRTATGWQIQTVDPDGASATIPHGLAVDDAGRPHLVYYETRSDTIKYARREGAGWVLETVDSNGKEGGHCTIALGPDGKVHVAYNRRFPLDNAQIHLKYAYRDDRGWHRSTADFGGTYGRVGGYPSLALGPDGLPRIAYGDLTGSYFHPVDKVWVYGYKPLKYAYMDASNRWHVEYIDQGDRTNVNGHVICSYGPNSLVIVNGESRVAYADSGTGGRVKLARRTGTGWARSVIVNRVWNEDGASMVVDDTGRSHLVHRDISLDGNTINYLAEQQFLSPPRAPGNLVTTLTGPSTITLTWQDNSTDESRFVIERARGTDPAQVIAVVAANVTNFNDTGLAVGNYTYTVRACRQLMAISLCSDRTAPATATVPLELFPWAPTNLKATVRSSSEVSLTWDDNSRSEAGYLVERRSGTGAWSVIATLGPNTESYLNTDVSPGAYSYRVRAFSTVLGSTRHSAYSQEASVLVTLSLAPEPPADLTVTVLGTDSIRLDWLDSPSGCTGYKVERKTTGTWTTIATVNATTDHYVDTGLLTGTAYTYRVRAYRQILAMTYHSTYTGEKSGTPAILFGPPAPSRLRGMIGTGAITLTWSDNSNSEEGFKIERLVGTGSWQQVATVGPNVTTWEDTGAGPLLVHSYRVRAWRTFMGISYHSGYSNEIAMIIPLDLTPAAPGGLQAIARTHSEIGLSWLDLSNNEFGFSIERRSGTGTWVEVGTVGANETSYFDSGLSPLTSYRYRLRAYTYLGETRWYSSYSAEASVTTPVSPAPPIPGGLTVTGVTPSQVRLSWHGSGQASGYLVQRSQFGSAPAIIADLASGTTSYTDVKVEPGTSYTYRVSAYKTSSGATYHSNLSAPVTASTPVPPPPAAPSSLTAKASETGITLAWKDMSTNELGFAIERRVGSDSFLQIGSIGPNIVSFTDQQVEPGTEYGYRVRAYNAGGSSAPSNLASATASGTPRGDEVTIRLYIDRSTYYVNDQPAELDAEPIIFGGRTLLPIRAVIESLGGEMAWDPADRRVTITLGANVVEVWIGSNQGRINGQLQPIDPGNLDVMPIVVPPGRTMLPMRFIAEAIDCKVQWDPVQRMATVVQ